MKILKTLFVILFITYGGAQADEFVPSGSMGFTQTFYGNSGKYKTSTSHPSLFLNYNFSPEWGVQIEWDRLWNTYHFSGKSKQQDNSLSQPVGTLNYTYGYLGSSRVNWSSALTIENRNTFRGIDPTYTFISTSFDFHEYLPTSKYINATQFAISPKYIYGWQSRDPSGHVNTSVLSMLTNWTLPANFSLTLNAHLFREWYNGSMIVYDKSTQYSNANYFMLSAWLNYNSTLYQFNDKAALEFNFVGGFDPYIVSNKKAGWHPFLADNLRYEWPGPSAMSGEYRSTYTLFALPKINFSYQYDKKLQLSTFIQAKYFNQVWGSTEKDWRLQPQIGFGAIYNF
ncbi:FomA family porin-like outer membrane protein [Providencia sp. Me31A]|uniref:FomA family porin-like outer membrane protein n=1 Tax=Providencia sp. Me31A TaxID=3392637 RepID=UPI003D29CA67